MAEEKNDQQGAQESFAEAIPTVPDWVQAPDIYVDTAEVVSLAHTIILTFGTFEPEGHVRPRVRLRMNPGFANHLRRIVTDAVVAYQVPGAQAVPAKEPGDEEGGTDDSGFVV